MKVNINVKSDKGKIKYYDIESISEFLSKIKGSIRNIQKKILGTGKKIIKNSPCIYKILRTIINRTMNNSNNIYYSHPLAWHGIVSLEEFNKVYEGKPNINSILVKYYLDNKLYSF